MANRTSSTTSTIDQRNSDRYFDDYEELVEFPVDNRPRMPFEVFNYSTYEVIMNIKKVPVSDFSRLGLVYEYVIDEIVR